MAVVDGHSGVQSRDVKRAPSLPLPGKVIHTRGQIFLYGVKSSNSLTCWAFSLYSAPLFSSFGSHLLTDKTRRTVQWKERSNPAIFVVVVPMVFGHVWLLKPAVELLMLVGLKAASVFLRKHSACVNILRKQLLRWIRTVTCYNTCYHIEVKRE